MIDEMNNMSPDIEKSNASSEVGKSNTSSGVEKSPIHCSEGGVTPPNFIKHAIDPDEAMKAFEGHEGEVLIMDAATNKRLRRKIDLVLMPLLCTVYGLNILDKTTLSYASITGLQTDLKLVGDDYQWLGSLFYFGYLAWSYPTSRLLQRLPLAKYSSFCIIMWGLVLSCFAAVSNYKGAIAVRIFLGVFESTVVPSAVLLTSQWYKKHEQGFRMGMIFGAAGAGQIFGGAMAYGIAQGTSVYPAAIAPWKIIFLVTGLLTIFVGFIFLLVVPDNQLNCWWLSKDDRRLAIERVRINQQGIGNKHFKMYQLKEALTDPLTWAYVFYVTLAGVPNGGITNFFSQLIVSFGYSPQESLLYGGPGGAVAIVSFVALGYLGDHYGNRILFSCVGLLCGILGLVLIVALPLSNSGGRLAGYYLTQAGYMPYVTLLSLIGTNVAGYTKKTTVAAMFLVAYTVGDIIGPQTFRPSDAPRFVPAAITMIACWSAGVIDMMFIWWYYRRQNRKKAAIRAQPFYTKVVNQEFLDLTDIENPELIYTL